MTIRSTQPDAAADALPLARTVLGCVEGRLDGKRNHTSVVAFLRLVRGFAAHGFEGHLAERRPVSGRTAPASVPPGIVGLDRLRAALGQAFESAFEGEAPRDAVDRIEFCLTCLVVLGDGRDGHDRAVRFLRDLVGLLESPMPEPATA